MPSLSDPQRESHWPSSHHWVGECVYVKWQWWKDQHTKYKTRDAPANPHNNILGPEPTQAGSHSLPIWGHESNCYQQVGGYSSTDLAGGIPHGPDLQAWQRPKGKVNRHLNTSLEGTKDSRAKKNNKSTSPSPSTSNSSASYYRFRLTTPAKPVKPAIPSGLGEVPCPYGLKIRKYRCSLKTVKGHPHGIGKHTFSTNTWR